MDLGEIGDFLGQYELFGLGLVVLVPFLVQGVKAAYAAAFGKEMPAWGQIVTVIVVCWGLLAAHAVVTYSPQNTPYVKYTLAAVLLPLACMGAYSGAKALWGKKG